MKNANKLEGRFTISQKILQPHLYIKLFSYLIMLLVFCLTIATTLNFYSSTDFSLKYFQTSQKNSPPTTTTTASQPSRPPRTTPGVGLRDHIAHRHAMHVKSDVELLRRVSSETKVPKIGFMFLVKEGLPLAPIWEEFFKGYKGFYSIYVHSSSDNSSINASMGFDTGVFRGTRISSQEVGWGKFSMVEAELRLLENALLDTNNQRFVLLSESCIPLFNFSTIYTYLINSTQSHIESYDDIGPNGRARYKPLLSPNITIRQWRKGSQWFEIDRATALEIVSDRGFFTLFKRACGDFPCYADEHYFATWMNVNKVLGGRHNSNRSLTNVDWSKGGCHPAKYRRMHVTIEFLEELRSGRKCGYNHVGGKGVCLFARKFLPDSLDRLLRFAPEVMQF